MDAVASEISLVDRSSRCAIHIFTQTRFLEATLCYILVKRNYIWEPLKTGTRADFVHDLYQMLGTKPQ